MFLRPGSFFSFAGIAVLVAMMSGQVVADAADDYVSSMRERIGDDERVQRIRSWIESIESGGRGTPSEILTVGPGSGCDYTSLTSALFDAFDEAEIRLTSGTYTGTFSILDGRSLTIRGGFEDCSAATPSGSSTLDGNGSGPVFDIFNDTAESTVRLEGLNLINGSSGNLAGGLQVEGSHFVELIDVELSANSSSGHGGGLQLKGDGGSAVYMDDVIIDNNSADTGGGIACIADGGIPILAIASGSIAQNTASTGGGIDSEGCFVETHAGGFLQGIFNNEATTSGGGISAREQSTVGVVGGPAGLFVQGNPEESAYVYSNSADSMGGGILAIGNSEVTVLDGVVRNNTATYGGGVMVHSGAFFEMIRGDATDCVRYESTFSPAPCSRLEDNYASDYGGAIALTNGSALARIAQTFIAGNEAINYGSVLFTLGADVGMEGNVIHDNPGVELFEIRQAAKFDLTWSTIADNPSSSASEPLVKLQGSGLGTTTLIMQGNVFADDVRSLVSRNEVLGPVSVTAACMIAHELGSVPEATGSLVASPGFVNAADDDYHLDPASPAVDFCAGSPQPEDGDMDAEQRGMPYASATSTPFDAGADEVMPDRIFSDRFEQ